MPSHNRISHPVHDHIPFTMKEEFILSLTVMECHDKKQVMNTDVFKSLAIRLAKDLNLHWAFEEHYDEWYQGFCKRNPFAYTVLHPEMNPLERQRAHILEHWDQMLQSELPSKLVAVNNDEEEEILDINEQNQLVFRPRSSNEIANILYANWLFNKRGYPDGCIVAMSTSDIQRMNNEMINQSLSHTGCSFDQEIYDGLRMHAGHAFGFGLQTTRAADDAGKFLLRRLLQSRSARVQMPQHEIPDHTLATIVHKVSNTFRNMDIPYDPRPMYSQDESILNLFDSTLDMSIHYTYFDLLNYYQQNCQLDSVKMYSHHGLGLNLKRLFPTYSTTQVRIRRNYATDCYTVTSGVIPKCQTSDVVPISGSVLEVYERLQ